MNEPPTAGPVEFVRALQESAQQSQVFEQARPRQCAYVNWGHTAIADELRNGLLGVFIVTGDKYIQFLPGNVPGDQCAGKGRIKGLDKFRPGRGDFGKFLRRRTVSRNRQAVIGAVERVGYIDDRLSGQPGAQLLDDLPVPRVPERQNYHVIQPGAVESGNFDRCTVFSNAFQLGGQLFGRLTARGDQGDRMTARHQAVAAIIGRKWVPLIIRDLAQGVRRFGELQSSLSVSPRVLSTRLQELENEQLIRREVFAEVPPRVEYALTEKGSLLVPVIDEMRRVGRNFIKPK